jgi:hypothetical protein
MNNNSFTLHQQKYGCLSAYGVNPFQYFVNKTLTPF